MDIQLRRADEKPAPKDAPQANRQTGSDLKPVIVDEASAELKNVPARQWAAAFSPDGRRLATTSVDHDPKLWDLKSGTLIANLQR